MQEHVSILKRKEFHLWLGNLLLNAMLPLITVQRDLVQDNFCQYLAFSFEPTSNLEAYEKLLG